MDIFVANGYLNYPIKGDVMGNWICFFRHKWSYLFKEKRSSARYCVRCDKTEIYSYDNDWSETSFKCHCGDESKMLEEIQDWISLECATCIFDNQY